MSKNILVIGGTGMLGLPVARKLLEDGFRVALMSSRPEQAKVKVGADFPVIPGDVTDIKSLSAAFEDQNYIYINLNGNLDPKTYEAIEIQGTANIARAAVESGIEKIGMISGASSQGVEKGIIYLDAKVRAERSLIESGIPYVIMRPSWFFESLPLAVVDGRAGVLGEQPVPRSWLAAADFARQVSNAFQKDEASNKCFYNLGPEKILMLTAIEKFCERFHPDIKPESISFFKAHLASYLPGMGKLKLLIPFFEYFEDNSEDVDGSEADRILGPNLTTLEEWLDDYAKNK
ncbi:MAG: SDR family oxidoreductase [Candidatus Zixiibacteriota bacterium]